MTDNLNFRWDLPSGILLLIDHRLWKTHIIGSKYEIFPHFWQIAIFSKTATVMIFYDYWLLIPSWTWGYQISWDFWGNVFSNLILSTVCYFVFNVLQLYNHLIPHYIGLLHLWPVLGSVTCVTRGQIMFKIKIISFKFCTFSFVNALYQGRNWAILRRGRRYIFNRKD